MRTVTGWVRIATLVTWIALTTQGLSRYPRQSSFYFPQNVSYGLEQDPSEAGPWAPWTESSLCTRSCGGGVSFQSRICLDVRNDGSHSCVGASRRYFSCNTESCPKDSKDFRESQCARFNTVPFEQKYYSWVPFYRAPNPCELNCMPKGERFYHTHDKKVIDGTPCYPNGSLDICIDGSCIPVGCDLELGSNTKEDKCRVCGGDGTSCRPIEGLFDSDDFQVGYNDILLIPKGATHIYIREMFPTNNYLALRDLKNNYFLNGNWRIEYPKEIEVAGTIFHYERKPGGYLAPESLRSLGPTLEPIFLVLLYQEENKGISYEYSIPIDASITPPEIYSWSFGDFENCTRNCGGGEQKRPVFCTLSHSSEIIGDEFCDINNRPNSNQSCNVDACPANWDVGNWSECINPDTSGFQYRNVYCFQELPDGMKTVVTDELCEIPKPDALQDCAADENGTASSSFSKTTCAYWSAEPYGECEGKCGEGTQERQIKCYIDGEPVDDSECETIERIAESQTCDLPPCDLGLDWITSEWSGCEKGCGYRKKTREVLCSSIDGQIFDDKFCTLFTKPESETECTDDDVSECEAQWFTSSWGECSTLCGNGVRTRHIFCGLLNPENETIEVMTEESCFREEKPLGIEFCTRHENCTSSWFTGPWNACSIPCGGGEETRAHICLDMSDGIKPSEDCSNEDKLFDSQPCELKPCDDDEFILLSDCKNSTNGCCPDGKTPAGVNFTGCPLIATDEGGCEKTRFGCCPDEIMPAFGPFKLGCFNKIEPCNETEFGCCEDGLSAATGLNLEGCPRECEMSEWGCCPDMITPATGENSTGCDLELSCNETLHGCCPDGITSRGDEGSGCPEGSGDACGETLYGCCPDGITIATGPNMTGCLLRKCAMVSGNDTLGSGDDQLLCTDMEGSGDMIENCQESPFGCCSDNTTSASGPNYEGCFSEPIDCINSTFGCCPDNMTLASGPDNEGCEEMFIDCSNTTYGCCPDNYTIATGPENEGCEEIDCSNTTAGCNISSCANTTFGCCPDNTTEAKGPNMEDCVEKIELIEIIEIHCSNSTFGCCSDSETTAHGPNEEGCCVIMEYGCCPDNLTAALGPELMGCGCQTLPHGCCPDGISPAQGPRFYGCSCREYPYGCCQDNYTPARGPEFDGCICSRMLYGCCEDQVTPATGPNHQGCRCELSAYGCCPDKTIARGPNFEGCPCDTLPYGCCPDGRTPARSYEYLGCPCETLHYGCCPDGHTPSKGPNHEGCPCITSRYGCCPDGITQALGPDFSGCSDTAIASRTVGPEVCHLTKDRGSCHNFTVKWYFDINYGGCSRFWYGGCEGNGNAFNTQVQCEHACVKPEGPEACLLPKVKGPCEGNENKWYYDVSTQSCEHFIYGGCLGNNNRYPSKEACEQTCISPKETTDVCEQPLIVGLCRGSFPRWHYDSHTRKCKKFSYGGCQGNDNNFESEQGCIQRCGGQIIEQDVCRLEKMEGSCQESLLRWYFDFRSGNCREFVYSGCDGNGNQFPSKQHCEHQCRQIVEPSDICKLTKDEGPCKATILQWYYSYSTERCEQFYYGGCDGNANRFSSRSECESSCITKSKVTSCSLPYEVGNCYDYQEKWFYDEQAGQCRRFYYSGCGGNANNYDSLADCKHVCESTVTTTPATVEFKKEYCAMEKDSGFCSNNQVHWYYDKTDGVCKEFLYGGCEGNYNRFKTRKECEHSCSDSQDICSLPKIRGTCSGSFSQWFYDASEDECQEFEFSGCKGNANRFNDKVECESACKQYKVVPIPAIEDVCSLPRESGPCTEYSHMFYYDGTDNTCKTFIYGGCMGNENRFESEKKCEMQCATKTTEITIDRRPTSPPYVPRVPEAPRVPQDTNSEICRSSFEIGHCAESQLRYYYDASIRTCLSFTYSGCGGNKNRFKSIEICERFCNNIGTEESEPESPQCPASTCDNLNCPFGMQEIPTDDGCRSCQCLNPCDNIICPYGQQCLMEGSRPVCQQVSKEGQCPYYKDAITTCGESCREDANCPGNEKCCYTETCIYSCMQPYEEPEISYTPAPPIYKHGQCPSSKTSLEVCDSSCREDRDCSGNKKCCYTETCAYTCIEPTQEVTPEPSIPISEPPQVEAETKVVTTSSEIVLPCSPTGTTATIWNKNGYPLDNTDLRLRVFSDGSLQIIDIQENDYGVYTCSGVDSYNLLASKSYNVKVHELLKVEIELVTKEYRQGTPIQLNCKISGTKPYETSWYFDGKVIADEPRRQIRNNNTLYIPEAELIDNGLYHCTAKNEYATRSDSITLKVEESDVPVDCQDSPLFKGCDFIIKANYCNNKDYAKYCCFSCVQAGLLKRP